MFLLLSEPEPTMTEFLSTITRNKVWKGKKTTVLLLSLIYFDRTCIPSIIEYGVLTDKIELWVERFEN